MNCGKQFIRVLLGWRFVTKMHRVHGHQFRTVPSKVIIIGPSLQCGVRKTDAENRSQSIAGNSSLRDNESNLLVVRGALAGRICLSGHRSAAIIGISRPHLRLVSATVSG